MIGIGLAPSATSKGPQLKTTEPIVSNKVTNFIVFISLNLRA